MRYNLALDSIASQNYNDLWRNDTGRSRCSGQCFTPFNTTHGEVIFGAYNSHKKRIRDGRQKNDFLAFQWKLSLVSGPPVGGHFNVQLRQGVKSKRIATNHRLIATLSTTCGVYWNDPHFHYQLFCIGAYSVCL